MHKTKAKCRGCGKYTGCTKSSDVLSEPHEFICGDCGHSWVVPPKPEKSGPPAFRQNPLYTLKVIAFSTPIILTCMSAPFVVPYIVKLAGAAAEMAESDYPGRGGGGFVGLIVGLGAFGFGLFALGLPAYGICNLILSSTSDKSERFRLEEDAQVVGYFFGFIGFILALIYRIWFW